MARTLDFNTLEEGKIYSLGSTAGLDGYQNQFMKQGKAFVPVVGQAENITALDWTPQEILMNAGSIRPLDYAIKTGQTKEQAQSLYDTALNDTTTPRVSFDFSKTDASGNPLATTMTGAEGLAKQNADRIDYNAETNKVVPYGYQETAQDKMVRENLAKGIPIGSANAPKEQPKYVSTYKGNSIIDFLNSVKQDSSFANRAKLAAEQGITGYKGTAEQNLALLAKLRGATSPTPATETPESPTGTTTASSMTSEEKITTPGATPGADTAGAMVTGASTTLAEFMKQLTPAETETEKKQQTLLDKMTSLVGDAAKQSADQLTAEQAAGIPELKKKFADINGQILTKSAEYNVLQAANANKPITMNSIIGNERAILNAKAADIGLLTAQAQALQGQIQTAQDTVNRSIDLKYDTISKQLDVYQAQLSALEPTLNKEEKRLATAQQLMIEERKQALEDKKSAEKEKSGVILDLIGQYPDAGITFTDTLAQAQAKLPKSRIYQDKVRGPVGTGTTPTGTYVRGANTVVDSWVDQINTGKATIANVPANLKNAVISALSSTSETAKSQVIAPLISLTDSILNNKYLGQVTGAINPFTYWTPGSNEQLVKNQLNELKANLSLENRQKLKGTGAISDFESRTLERASSALGSNLSDDDAKKELRKIKGVFQTSSGLEATVTITDPKTGQSKTAPLGRDGINSAIAQGFLVEY